MKTKNMSLTAPHGRGYNVLLQRPKLNRIMKTVLVLSLMQNVDAKYVTRYEHLDDLPSHGLFDSPTEEHLRSIPSNEQRQYSLDDGEAQPVPTLPEASISKFTFHPRYGRNGECQCFEVEWGEYETKHDCLSDYVASKNEACRYNGEGVSDEDCDFSVATYPTKTNTYCRDACLKYVEDPTTWTDFRNFCRFERYRVANGGVHIHYPVCFNQIIYGHSDDSANVVESSLSFAYRIIEDVQTAANCQSICQEDIHCENFFWRRLPTYSHHPSIWPNVGRPEPAAYRPFTCFLKNAQMVSDSVNAVISSNYEVWTPPANSHVCDHNIPSICSGDYHFGRGVCMKCSGNQVCAWKSYAHVAGPRHCSRVPRVCDIASVGYWKE